MKRLLFVLPLLCGCLSKSAVDKSDMVVSMQLIDRNGFVETISNKDRLSSYKATDFLSAQPYQKVLRIYGRNLKGQSTSRITSYHENGGLNQYLEAIDGRANGVYREWFPNGQQKIEAHLIEGTADLHELAQATWVFDGTSTVWDEEGNKIALFYYAKGLLVSQATTFFPNGKTHELLPYEKGELHGVCQTFDETGNLCEEIPYSEGKKEGTASCFWSPSQPRSKELYKEGKLIEATFWDQKGAEVASVKEAVGQMAQFEENTLSSLLSIKDGLVEGEVLVFNQDGSLHDSYQLHEGKKRGEEWEYYLHKKGDQPFPKLCVHWDDDQIQGLIKTWYENGQIESQREINNNKKHGASFAWYKNGDLMLTEEYENDLLVKGTYYKKGDKKAVSRIDSGKGTAHLYTPEGIFLKKVTYEKGKPLLFNDSIP